MTREEAVKVVNSFLELSYFDITKEALTMAIAALEQPEPKKGKWLDTRDYCGEFLCSNCHETNINDFYKYCPNCGAKMIEEGDDNAD